MVKFNFQYLTRSLLKKNQKIRVTFEYLVDLLKKNFFTQISYKEREW